MPMPMTKAEEMRYNWNRADAWWRSCATRADAARDPALVAAAGRASAAYRQLMQESRGKRRDDPIWAQVDAAADTWKAADDAAYLSAPEAARDLAHRALAARDAVEEAAHAAGVRL
jgi:hypothetical protein